MNVAVEDGALILRGVNEHALPDGLYKLKVEIEEAKTPGKFTVADVKHDSHAVVNIDVQLDERGVKVDLDDAMRTSASCSIALTIDDVAAATWLEDASRRPTRQACLLNLLASLRTRPTPRHRSCSSCTTCTTSATTGSTRKSIARWSTCCRRCRTIRAKPFYAEGTPRAAVHGRLLSGLPEPPEVRARFTALSSFRGEGKPSMQAVVAIPPPDLPHTYAEFDLDLGNPLQDVLGFFVHMGELLDGKADQPPGHAEGTGQGQSLGLPLLHRRYKLSAVGAAPGL